MPEVRETLRRRGVYHTIRSGQTLWRISRAYGADVEQIAVLNGINNPDRLRAGVRIFIPGAIRVVAVPGNGRSSAPRKRPNWAEPAKRKSRAPRKSARRMRAARKVSQNSVRFVWPVRGKVVRGFGSRNGVKYDGIAISAPRRATVRAAATGRVIFSDWGPGSLGRTVIIRHAGGVYHSVYAHNAVNLVKRGQKVRQGSPIARVGQTGNAQKAQLHFEIRYRTKPRDPLTYLP
jgi:lipoprotein NlpD